MVLKKIKDRILRIPSRKLAIAVLLGALIATYFFGVYVLIFSTIFLLGASIKGIPRRSITLLLLMIVAATGGPILCSFHPGATVFAITVLGFFSPALFGFLGSQLFKQLKKNCHE